MTTKRKESGYRIMKKEITIFEKNIYSFEEKIKKFNKKLAKYGKDEKVEYSIGEPYDYQCTLDGYTIVVRLVRVEFDDVTVTLNEKHRIVAKIELPTKEDTVVTIYDRKYKVEDFQHIKELSCDHCKSNRRRKKGFIIENIATGELLQIGATCMKDYTQDLAIMDKMRFQADVFGDYEFDELDFMKGSLGVGYGETWFNVEDLLVFTNRVVSEKGFVSVTDAEYNRDLKSTKDEVLNMIYSTNRGAITEEELKVANEMLDVIKSCEIESIISKDFNIKLLDMVKNRYCKSNQFGLAVWIYKLYETIINYKEPEVIHTINEYYGEVGKELK